MTPIHYRTAVFLAPATPLGLLPAEWKVEHRCTICRQPGVSAHLIDHAKSHAELAQSDRGDVLPTSTEGGHAPVRSVCENPRNACTESAESSLDNNRSVAQSGAWPGAGQGQGAVRIGLRSARLAAAQPPRFAVDDPATHQPTRLRDPISTSTRGNEAQGRVAQTMG